MTTPDLESIAPLTRRQFIGGLGAGAIALATAHASELAATTAASKNIVVASPDILRKTIAHSGESLPAIGMGSFMTFDVRSGQPRNTHLEVLRRFYDGGGRVVDTSPLYGNAEINVGELSSALGLSDKLFFTDKVWVTGDYLSDTSHGQRSLDQSMGRLWRDQIDVIQVHSLTNVEIMLPFLNEMKKQGRIRYVGVTHHDPRYFEPLAWWVENGPIDFVQVRYSMYSRAAEERIFPAAQRRGLGVMLNMPLEKARLHKIVEGRPLPDFAADIGVHNWAQFFLKWAISHPAVTCALPATTHPEHMSENLGAMRGPLPDAPMRDRMLRYMQSVPGFNDLDKMPWYPGKAFQGLVHLSA